MTPFAEIQPTSETVACAGDITEPVPPVVTDNCGNVLTPVGPVRSSLPSCEGSKTFTWTYTDCAGNKRDYVHTVKVEYQPFPPIAPTSETFDRASDIVLPQMPVVTDNCGNVLNPAGPVITPGTECQDDATYVWTYTDCAGNSQEYVHEIKIKDCVPLNHCTYTQGFYGNANGKNCLFTGTGYEKTGALEMMTRAFGSLDHVLFGSLSNGKYFKLMSGSITASATPEGIFQMLPGGGTPAALIGEATSMDEMSLWGNVPRSVQAGSLGRIKNNLLSQAITLFFNIQNDGTLGSLRITGRYMVTLKSSECGSMIPVANSGSYTEIPQSVLDYFDANGLTGSVNDLYDLANKVLGGETINPEVSAGDVTMAVDAINVGFDECRILSEFTSDLPGVPRASSESYDFGKKRADVMMGELREAVLTVYPNPFRTTVRFQLEMISDSHVKVEIYNHAGALLKIIFSEDLKQGDIRTTEFDASMYAHSAFLYKVVTDSSMKSGTIVKVR
jgi:hypothetical protein